MVLMSKKDNKNLYRSVFVLALLFVLITIFYFIEPIKIFKNTSTSMNPTINKGQKIIAIKIFRELNVGDIVIAEIPSLDISVLKRVIAKSEDKVEVKNSNIYVNGKLLYSNLVSDYTDSLTILKKNEYYLLGDNINDSYDSRFYGPVKKENISYKYLFTVNYKMKLH